MGRGWIWARGGDRVAVEWRLDVGGDVSQCIPRLARHRTNVGADVSCRSPQERCRYESLEAGVDFTVGIYIGKLKQLARERQFRVMVSTAPHLTTAARMRASTAARHHHMPCGASLHHRHTHKCTHTAGQCHHKLYPPSLPPQAIPRHKLCRLAPPLTTTTRLRTHTAGLPRHMPCRTAH